MQVPIEVSLRHVPNDSKLIDLMNEGCRGLGRTVDNIISCRVSLEKEQDLNTGLGLYRFKTEIALPGRHRIVVKKEANISGNYPKLAALIRATFKKAHLLLRRLKGRQMSRLRLYRKQKNRLIM